MTPTRMTIVLSRTPGQHPSRRAIEDELATLLATEPTVELSVLPHLYDLPVHHPAMERLRSAASNLVVLAWLYPRATRWLLDRNHVRGRAGQTQLGIQSQETAQTPAMGVAAAESCERYIYCLDLRDHHEASGFAQEIQRILALHQGTTGQEQQPSPDTAGTSVDAFAADSNAGREQAPKRRWYPVIDFDRCNNCLECIDFCLFGVYGIDAEGRILVESPDSCKQGCPACSRVCPESAIMFPEYKTAAIAGAENSETPPGSEGRKAKIDLSSLLGGPSASAVADRERRAALARAGRQPPGTAGPASQKEQPAPAKTPDELDQLLDRLDELDI